jgi:hypothetical protein
VADGQAAARLSLTTEICLGVPHARGDLCDDRRASEHPPNYVRSLSGFVVDRQSRKPFDANVGERLV